MSGHPMVRRFRWKFVFGSKRNSFRSQCSRFEQKRNWAEHPRVRRFRLNFFSVLSETVFAYIFPVSNENENKQRTLGLF